MDTLAFKGGVLVAVSNLGRHVTGDSVKLQSLS
jgi:hypothetical protein